MREKTRKAQESIDSRGAFVATLRGKKSNRDLWRTGLATKPRNFVLPIGTRHIQGFIGIVCKLSESKTYPTSSFILSP